jgi:hypothetical protein
MGLADACTFLVGGFFMLLVVPVLGVELGGRLRVRISTNAVREGGHPYQICELADLVSVTVN